MGSSTSRACAGQVGGLAHTQGKAQVVRAWVCKTTSGRRMRIAGAPCALALVLVAFCVVGPDFGTDAVDMDDAVVAFEDMEGSPKTEAAKKKLQLDYDAATNAREKNAKAMKKKKEAVTKMKAKNKEAKKGAKKLAKAKLDQKNKTKELKAKASSIKKKKKADAAKLKKQKAKAKKNSKKPRKKSTPPGVKMAGLKANMKKEALKTQGSEVLQKNKLGMDRVRSTRKTAIEAKRKLREVSAKVKEKEVINADAK